MRSSISLLSIAVTLAIFSAGCAGPEQKLGRGINNVTEFTRLGEMSRSIEQTALWEGANSAYTTGVIRGFNRSLVRTAVGAFEIVTFPLPRYGPHFAPKARSTRTIRSVLTPTLGAGSPCLSIRFFRIAISPCCSKTPFFRPTHRSALAAVTSLLFFPAAGSEFSKTRILSFPGRQHCHVGAFFIDDPVTAFSRQSQFPAEHSRPAGRRLS